VIRKRNETKTFELIAFLKKRSQFSNEDNGKNAKPAKEKSFGFGGDKMFHIGWRQSLSRFCYI